jgi:hypothetical protein
MPGAFNRESLTTHPGSDLRRLEIEHNNIVADLANLSQILLTDSLVGWIGIGPNSLAAPMGIGSTDTNIATAKAFLINQGVMEVKAVVDAGTALGALGTVPADTWAIIAVNSGSTGTLTYQSGAVNYTTGYASEALALAALPQRLTVVTRLGHFTLKTKAATAWVAGTDALATGATGNPASATNYYPQAGIASPTGVAPSLAAHPAWSGGENGILIPTVLAIGSNDVQVSWTAFTFNAGQLANVPKAASTSTAYGALGTIPADKWGLIALIVDGAAVQTFKSAPSNYDSGYASEALAINALAAMAPPDDKALMGYVTIKTKAATAFVVGTDSPKGGATGNVASATNYYPTPGIALAQGQVSAQIATKTGVIVSTAQY